MPYCSFCCKDTVWLFDSEHVQSIWYTCDACKERYAVYKMQAPTLLQEARQMLAKFGDPFLDKKR